MGMPARDALALGNGARRSVLSGLPPVKATWLHHCKANAKVVLNDRGMVVRNDVHRTFLACLADMACR